jgi:hypothetical protein
LFCRNGGYQLSPVESSKPWPTNISGLVEISPSGEEGTLVRQNATHLRMRLAFLKHRGAIATQFD